MWTLLSALMDLLHINTLLHKLEGNTGSIWFEAGSIGLTVGWANTEAEG